MTMSNNKMMVEFKKIFDNEYFTSDYERLFGTNTSIGWFKYNNNLFIINYEYYAKNKSISLKQVTKYYNIAKKTEEFKKYSNCYLIVGYGIKPLKCEIYSTIDGNINLTTKKLEDLKNDETESKIFNQDLAHNFNQYFHDKFNKYLNDNNIKLTTEKIFFVIAIMLCRKINPDLVSYFKDKTDGFIIADYLTKLIKDYYKDTIFYKSFEFLKYNSNNKHFYKLIKMLDFDVKYYTNDVLNRFYSEFRCYNENPKDGIVLTPHDIVELMVRELKIKKGESVMDCCTGTGSFLIEASKYTDNLIGCEIKEDLYSIAKSNFILHDLKTDKLFFNNCFNQKFDMYDHIILNPPFSINCNDNGEIKDKYGWRILNEERKFIIYQLQFLKENGTGCFIIPRKNFNNSQSFALEFKKLLLGNCQILKIYNCNGDVFYPNAKIECIICVFKKYKSDEEYETEIIDYSNDGYNVSKNKRYKNSEPIIKKYKEILTCDNDWNYQNIRIKLPSIQSIYCSFLNNEYIRMIKTYEPNTDYLSLSKEYKEFVSKSDNMKKLKLKEWIEIKIGDYFNIVKGYRGYTQKTKSGIYPLITRSEFNNGITKYINDYSLDGEYITIAPSGSSGATFHQKGKFAVDKQIKVLELKKDKVLDLGIFSIVCSYLLKQKYSYNNGLTEEKMLNEVIYYPIIEIIE